MAESTYSPIVPSPWRQHFARFGSVSKGTVYLLVGFLAVRASLGERSPITDHIGALQVVVAQPMGIVLLTIITLGLAAYVVWRFLQALQPPPDDSDGPVGWARRASYVANGLIYAGITYGGIEILTGSPIAGNDEPAEDWTALLFSYPYGRWLIAIAGLVVIGYALTRVYRAYHTTFDRQLDLSGADRLTEATVINLGRIGMTARSIVYVIIGGFLVQAAWQYDAEKAGGLRDALDALTAGPLGPWTLGIVGLGLFAYGLHLLTRARYLSL